MQHLKWEKSGRTFDHGDEGKPNQFTFKSSIGQVNIDNGDQTFSPYLWDSNNKILRFGNCEIHLVSDGIEFWNGEELLNKFSFHPEVFENDIWKRKTSTIGNLSTLEIDNNGPKARLKVSYVVSTSDMEITINLDSGCNQKIHFNINIHSLIDGDQRVIAEFSKKGESISRKDWLGNDLSSKYDFIGKSRWGWLDNEISLHQAEQKVEYGSNSGLSKKFKPSRILGNDDLSKVLGDYFIDRTDFILGQKSYYNGEILNIHPDTWGSDVGIAANADDGGENGGTYYPDGTYLDNNFFGGTSTEVGWGLRWDNITILGTATINTCLIDIYHTDINSGSPASSVVRAWAHDDAPVFTDGGNEPGNVTGTVATVNYTPAGATSAWATLTDLSAVLKEVISRGGWVSGNAVNFFYYYAPNPEYYWSFEDYNNAGTNEPELTITYTPAAAGSILPLVSFGTLGGNCNPLMA